MNPRRRFLRASAAAGAGTALHALSPSYTWAASDRALPLQESSGPVSNLVIAKGRLDIDGQSATPTVVNGLLPGPVLRFREGETATIRVTNQLEETSSIHWHGLLVPPDMDGVPGVSFAAFDPAKPSLINTSCAKAERTGITAIRETRSRRACTARSSSTPTHPTRSHTTANAS